MSLLQASPFDYDGVTYLGDGIDVGESKQLRSRGKPGPKHKCRAPRLEAAVTEMKGQYFPDGLRMFELQGEPCGAKATVAARGIDMIHHRTSATCLTRPLDVSSGISLRQRDVVAVCARYLSAVPEGKPFCGYQTCRGFVVIGLTSTEVYMLPLRFGAAGIPMEVSGQLQLHATLDHRDGDTMSGALVSVPLVRLRIGYGNIVFKYTGLPLPTFGIAAYLASSDGRLRLPTLSGIVAAAHGPKSGASRDTNAKAGHAEPQQKPKQKRRKLSAEEVAESQSGSSTDSDADPRRQSGDFARGELRGLQSAWKAFRIGDRSAAVAYAAATDAGRAENAGVVVSTTGVLGGTETSAIVLCGATSAGQVPQRSGTTAAAAPMCQLCGDDSTDANAMMGPECSMCIECCLLRTERTVVLCKSAAHAGARHYVSMRRKKHGT